MDIKIKQEFYKLINNIIRKDYEIGFYTKRFSIDFAHDFNSCISIKDIDDDSLCEVYIIPNLFSDEYNIQKNGSNEEFNTSTNQWESKEIKEQIIINTDTGFVFFNKYFPKIFDYIQKKYSITDDDLIDVITKIQDIIIAEL